MDSTFLISFIESPEVIIFSLVSIVTGVILFVFHKGVTFYRKRAQIKKQKELFNAVYNAEKNRQSY